MDPKRIAPLLAVAAAGLVGLLFGCGELNHDPVITSLTATPDTTVRPGAVIVLAVSATDVDDDSLAFSWSATAGTLSATTGESVEWTAPDSATAGTVTVACSDGQGGEDSAFKAVNSRAWLEFDMDGYTPDSTHLANPGLTEAEFTFELDGDPFPPGSVADSVFITTDFVPDTLALEGFDVWVVSPTGTASLIYDGN
ncbi:hypothetical protein JXB37_07450, partial [candidate division WOR-3 bacterium]|nr:hypothetical protein [candidate division WOR-3 bacterium]